MMEGEGMKLLLEAARNTIGVNKFDEEHAVAIVPDSFSVKDLREFMAPPSRPQECVTLLTIPSFADYTNKFATEATAIFADETRATYRAVMDYHPAAGKRGNCDHVAAYTCPHSPEWLAWNANHGKLLAQADFARFVENNLPDIATPPQAEMLQMALSISVHKNASFASDLRLQNGQVQFRYEEEIRGTSKAGDMTIPEIFRIHIPIFLDRPCTTIDCRLRYRIENQKLVIGYEIVRREIALTQAVKAVTAEIKELLPDRAFYVAR